MGPVAATVSGRERSIADGDDRHDARRERGGVGGAACQVDRGAEPVGGEVRPSLRMHPTHADHDPAVERLVDTHRVLQLLDDELESSPSPIRHCEPPSAGRAADHRRA